MGCSLAGAHQAGPPLFPIWCSSRCGVAVLWGREGGDGSGDGDGGKSRQAGEVVIGQEPPGDGDDASYMWVWVGLIPTPMAASASSCTSLRNLSHQARRAALLYKESILLVVGVVEVTRCMPKKPSTAAYMDANADGDAMHCGWGCRCHLPYVDYDMEEAHMFVASVSGLALEVESKANFSMFQISSLGI